ncbi:molybdenum cofactor biosynthesis protein [Halarchaeum acidiphilum MH1-52-1]|uniref:Molybdenum cofactor biosynthesis protein n=1 Tax=Halarchaeum acidiphilum MH1-52-1 TaxID=1261545 RepID=U2YUD9_9EURY|nr:cyclic pyranopterin monophosphate synthase MoaC [Halarchaeum acidiphilum]GAD52635.1 molybdenum cofactor biosynthesis protein [Halarchaeum acidiphilum MH1-52-1]
MREDAEGDDADLTHTTESGDVQMVDVGAKPDTARRAVARGEIRVQDSTIAAIRDDEIGKGDVLATARVGAVQAVKHTWETIPMCHQIPITNVETTFDVEGGTERGEGSRASGEDRSAGRVVLEVAVETTGKTGCEMEALQGVTTGLNVVWDMVKAAEKREAPGATGRNDDAVAASQYPDTAIKGVEVVAKEKRELD